MTKYYCDICGKETSEVIEYTLPSIGKKEIYDDQKNVVALSFLQPLNVNVYANVVRKNFGQG